MPKLLLLAHLRHQSEADISQGDTSIFSPRQSRIHFLGQDGSEAKLNSPVHPQSSRNNSMTAPLLRAKGQLGSWAMVDCMLVLFVNAGGV